MRLLIGLCCLLMASTAMAKDFTMATVDMQKLFKAYPETAGAQKKLDNLTLQRKKDLADSEKSLKKLQDELSKDTLTSEQKSAKEKAFQDEAQNFQDEKTTIENELVEKQQEMIQEIVGKIKAVVATVAEKDGYDLVLDENDTVTANNSVDITDEVLKSFSSATSDSDSTTP